MSFFCPFFRFERKKRRDFEKKEERIDLRTPQAMRRAFGRQNASHQPVFALMLLILIV